MVQPLVGTELHRKHFPDSIDTCSRVHHFDWKRERIMANPFVHVELLTNDVAKAIFRDV
jgi:hypothetical protein